MPKLQAILSEDSEAALESIRFMSPDPTAVEAMTRTQLYLHMDIRERMLKAQYGEGWRKHFDKEFSEKRELWAAARDLHEAVKAARRTHA
jgi:hypothetical protein